MKLTKLEVLLLFILINSCSVDEEHLENSNTNNKIKKIKDSELKHEPPIILYDDLPTKEEDDSLSYFVIQGNHWDKTNLTYFHQNSTSDIANNEERIAIRQAFDLWSEVTPLVFSEVNAATNADIVIAFEIGDHGDGSPFDNGGSVGSDGPRRNVLAHAFFPSPNDESLAGDIHFDDFENWTLDERAPFTGQPIDIVTVAAHEIGHALGLRHTDIEGALMYPSYNGSHRFLHFDDIEGIQTIYGSNLFETTPIIDNIGSHSTKTVFYFSDVNGDGKSDKIYWNRDAFSGAVRVFLATSGGNFSSTPNIDNIGSHSTKTVFYFSDVNGDGKSDKIYWNRDAFSGAVRVFLATSGGNFSSTPNIDNIGSHSTKTVFYFSDVNGDGKSDKIYWNRDAFSGAVRVFLATSGGNFSSTPIIDNIGSHSTKTVFYFSDVNGDGKSDKIYWNRDAFSGAVRVFLATSGGNFSSTPIIDNIGSHSTKTVFYFSDVNGDGKSDKIYWNRDAFSGAVRVFLATSGGNFSSTPIIDNIGSHSTKTVFYFSDVNGDGKSDKIYWNRDAFSGAVRVFLAND